MDDFEIIDAHTHLARTIEEESNYFLIPGRRTRDRWATPERAIEYMDQAGISKMVFLTLIPRQYRGPLTEKARLLKLPEAQRRNEEKKIGEQVAPIMREFNEWGCEVGQRFPRLFPFSSISKELGDAKAMVEEVALRASQGAKGIKFHPGMFSFFPDDEEMWPVYEKCQELGLPILADSGLWPAPHVLTEFPSPVKASASEAQLDYAEPKNWARVLEAFPRLTVILAHLGSAWWDERVELAQKYPNVYFDTSQGFTTPDRIPYNPHRGLAEEDAVRIFHKIGVERILFGTDFPAIPFQPQLEQLLRFPLSDEEKRMLFSENAKRILHI
ncbi:MAG: amidohydrolase [Dehalococcoidia bacterium]|nr:MAG: amidohydrolase [Dehalococcoidia bacterium]